MDAFGLGKDFLVIQTRIRNKTQFCLRQKGAREPECAFDFAIDADKIWRLIGNQFA